jgi:hypothetical protein
MHQHAYQTQVYVELCRRPVYTPFGSHAITTLCTPIFPSVYSFAPRCNCGGSGLASSNIFSATAISIGRAQIRPTVYSWCSLLLKLRSASDRMAFAEEEFALSSQRNMLGCQLIIGFGDSTGVGILLILQLERFAASKCNGPWRL